MRLHEITPGVMYSVYFNAKEGIVANVDIKKYMEAGYAAQCHCRSDSALEYVEQQMEMRARLVESSIEVEIAPGLFAPSGYYWECDTLFRGFKK